MRFFAFPLSPVVCAFAVAALLGLGGCATAPTPAIPYTGDPVIDGNAHLAVSLPKDRVLWEYRVAAAALRRGQIDEARAKLDDALANVNGTLAAAGAADAAKARKLFSREDVKPYVGEPYERIMAGFYRGIIYWRDGEPDNARALFRNGEFTDSDTENKSYSGDWVLLDYLDGFVSARINSDGTDALARARASAAAQNRAPLPSYDVKANVLVFVEYGRGPRKYPGGENGELLKFATEESEVSVARLEVAGQTIPLPPYDDLNYQATTRGGRVMDHILGNKAVFKTGADTVGNVALAGALGTAAFGRGEDSGKAALALAAVGVLSKLASAATQTTADTRTWENLPQYLSFGALRLAPGDYPATLTFYDAGGRRIERRTQTFTISVAATADTIGSGSRDTVVFRSELND